MKIAAGRLTQWFAFVYALLIFAVAGAFSPLSAGGLQETSEPAAATAAEVQNVLDIILGQMRRQSSVADFGGKALPGGTLRFPLPVDSSVGMLTVLLTWPGSSLDLTLLSPSGERLAASTGGRAAATYQMLRVDAPATGVWTAVVKSVDVASAGEPFRLRAAADSPVRLKIEPLETQSSPAMRATLAGFPPTTAQVRARVERPDGKTDDADVEQDGSAFIARYSRADVAGSYTFMWSARAGDVTRVASRAVSVETPVISSVKSVIPPAQTAQSATLPVPTVTPAVQSVKAPVQTVKPAPVQMVKPAIQSTKTTVPNREPAMQGGTVQSIDGQYIRWNRGSLHGIHHGLPVRIVRHGQEIGRGRAIDVRAADSDIEIDMVSGGEIAVGDAVEVEIGTSAAGMGPP